MAFDCDPTVPAEKRSDYRRKKQWAFTRELTKAFAEEMEKTLKRMPEDFDGIDIRLLAERVVREKLMVKVSPSYRRKFNSIVTINQVIP